MSRCPTRQVRSRAEHVQPVEPADDGQIDVVLRDLEQGRGADEPVGDRDAINWLRSLPVSMVWSFTSRCCRSASSLVVVARQSGAELDADRHP